MIDSIELAKKVDREHLGESVEIDGVNSLDIASSTELAFWERENPVEVESSDAGCIICLPEIAGIDDKTYIKSPSPRIDFLKIVNSIYRTPPQETIIHESATVEEGAEIGERCWIGPQVYIGENVRIGDRVKIQSGTSVGGEGFSFTPDKDGKLWGQIHNGSVRIEDDVEIGSNCSIDRAIFKETVIGRGTKLDNLIHIAHQVEIGRNVWIAYNVGVSGSVRIGDRVMIHPNAAVAMHVEVEDDVTIAMNSAVLDDVEQETTVAGVPAENVN